MIAGLEQTVQRQIQAVGAVERENDAIGAFGSQQFGDFLASAVDNARRLDCRTVGASSDRGPVFTVVFVDRRVDSLGFGKTRGSVIEVNLQPPIEYIGRRG
jgi:hypothetical protein